MNAYVRCCLLEAIGLSSLVFDLECHPSGLSVADQRGIGDITTNGQIHMFMGLSIWSAGVCKMSPMLEENGRHVNVVYCRFFPLTKGQHRERQFAIRKTLQGV